MDLRYGSADENVRKRSIQDIILHERQRFEKETLKNTEVPECGFKSGRESDFESFETEPFLLCPPRAGELAVISAVNRLASRGIRARVFSPVILLPSGTQEDALRELMAQICRAAFADGIETGEVSVRVTDAVTRPIVIGTVSGEKFIQDRWESPADRSASDYSANDRSVNNCPASNHSANNRSASDHSANDRSSCDIVLAGPVGMEGTYILVSEQFELLQKRFPMSILMRMKGLGRELSVLRAAEAAMSSSVSAMVSPGEGGFFAGLWELSRKTGCGLDIDLQAVPLLQETVEITDFFGINPYAMRSAGCLLIASGNAEKTILCLQEQGRTAVRIGKLTGNKEKIIRNGEEIRYLDRPQTDALTQWYKDQEKGRRQDRRDP